MGKLFAAAVLIGCILVACKPAEMVQESSEGALADTSAVEMAPDGQAEVEEVRQEAVEEFVMRLAEDYAPQAGGVMATNLDFLSEGQLAVFEQAMILHPYLNYNNESWPSGEYRDDKPEPEHPMEDGRYYPAGGYEKWDDFYAYWTETFSPDYFDELLQHYGTFIEHEGYTWYAGGAACGHATTERAFEVVTATDQKIEFIAYGYGQGHDGEYYEDSYKIALTNSEEGWRCAYLSMLGVGEG